MKKIIGVLILTLSTINVFSQGFIDVLPDGETIGKTALIGVPLVLLGVLIFFLTSKSDKASSAGGCIGIILFVIGLVFLVPLFEWVHSIFGIIITIIFGLAFIGLIINWIRGK